MVLFSFPTDVVNALTTNPDFVTTYKDTPITINPLANDDDGGDGPLKAASFGVRCQPVSNCIGDYSALFSEDSVIYTPSEEGCPPGVSEYSVTLYYKAIDTTNAEEENAERLFIPHF